MPRPNNDPCHLKALRDHMSRERVFPPYSKIGEILGFRGKAGAHKVVKRLVAAGYLQHTAEGRIGPTDRFFELPYADDKLYAGLAEGSDWPSGVTPWTFDRFLIDRPNDTVIMSIRGDSMVEAGIFDGDVAVVERTNNAATGEFVAALVNGQNTIKELRFEDGLPVLVPHNKRYETIHPGQEFQIWGVVRGIVRQYTRGKRHSSKYGAFL